MDDLEREELLQRIADLELELEEERERPHVDPPAKIAGDMPGDILHPEFACPFLDSVAD